MRRNKDDSSSGYNWMDTYGDMVTLLLTLFVLLYSMSTIDSEKWKKLVIVLTGQGKEAKEVVQQDMPDPNSGAALYDVGSNNPTVRNDKKALEMNDSIDAEKNVGVVKEFDDLYYYLKKYVKDNNLTSEVNLYKNENFTFITFKNNIFFDGDSAVLRPEAKRILDVLSDALLSISDQIGEIRTYGHTARAGDANMPNSPEGDRMLSAMRANNVIIYLQMKNIIEPKKMVAEGYGENRPIVPHDGTEETRIKNRRVEIYISKTDSNNVSLDKIYEEINQSGSEG